MGGLTEFFIQNIEEVYFFYGLSFFAMGLAVFLELGHSSQFDFARALRPLAGFGLVHGSHEWFEMILLYHPEIANSSVSAWLAPLRLALLGSSFLMLVAFGARLVAGSEKIRLERIMQIVIIALWLLGLLRVIWSQPAGKGQITAADVYTRYSLAIPGAVLTVWGLILQRRKFIQVGMPSVGNDVILAAVAFGFYGGVGQLFATPSTIFPSTYLNTDIFIRLFGFPVQVLRAATACMAAIFIIRSLRAFEEETRRQIDGLREAQQAERRHLEEIRSELLHRTVTAQENERRRISHDLHDETGQTLTALGLGLRGLSETIQKNPQKAIQQAEKLEKVAVAGISELQRMVGGLHPPQLDDLGLRAALRWYAGEIRNLYGLPVSVSGTGPGPDLSSEERIVFFRIAQEAITNIVRHARASQATMLFNNTETSVYLSIEDNGQGFNVEETLRKGGERAHWGLLGMIERAALINGNCTITSQPGKGTCIEVTLDREKIK